MPFFHRDRQVAWILFCIVYRQSLVINHILWSLCRRSIDSLSCLLKIGGDVLLTYMSQPEQLIWLVVSKNLCVDCSYKKLISWLPSTLVICPIASYKLLSRKCKLFGIIILFAEMSRLFWLVTNITPSCSRKLTQNHLTLYISLQPEVSGLIYEPTILET